MKSPARRNPFAGCKEGPETARQERAESRGLQRHEARKSIEKPTRGNAAPAMFRKAGRGR